MRGGLHVVTTCLKDGQRLCETNLAVLAELPAYLSTVTGPWIVGGDWNLSPDALTASGWLSVVGGHIVQRALCTCGSSVLDYYVISATLPAEDVMAVRLNDGGFAPHWAVRLYMRGAQRHRAVRRLARPHKVTCDVFHGPSWPVREPRGGCSRRVLQSPA